MTLSSGRLYNRCSTEKSIQLTQNIFKCLLYCVTHFFVVFIWPCILQSWSMDGANERAHTSQNDLVCMLLFYPLFECVVCLYVCVSWSLVGCCFFFQRKKRGPDLFGTHRCLDIHNTNKITHIANWMQNQDRGRGNMTFMQFIRETSKWPNID